MNNRNKDVPDEHHKPVTGEWLPQDHRQYQKWLSGIPNHVDKNPTAIYAVLRDFKNMIRSSSRLTMLADGMFDEVPKKRPYNKSVDENHVVRDLNHLLAILNHILSTGPEWTENAHRVGVVGVPINAVLDYNMATSSGFAFFLDEEVNKSIKKILDVWGAFLKTEASADCLQGWLENATTLATVANKASSSDRSFEELFVCDPRAKYRGYKSWDDFFTRPLRDGVRPIASPEEDNIIANACESKPYKTQHDVKLRDRFWIKGQPYSAIDMLDHDNCAEQFVGGLFIKLFFPLSATTVNPKFEDFTETHGAEKRGQTPSQGYLSAIATRAVILIEAKNPAIGLMAFLAIGMTEVSTCDITVKPGQQVEKGDQLGMFHFGGSTHCLMFRKGVQVSQFPQPGIDHNIPVRSKVAVCTS